MNSKLFIDDKSYNHIINGDYESYVNRTINECNSNEINVVVYPKSKNLSDVMLNVESELITIIVEENSKTNKIRTKVLKNKIYPNFETQTNDDDYVINVFNNEKNLNDCFVISLEIFKNKKSNKNQTNKKRSSYKIAKVESKLVTTVIERNFRSKLEKKKIFTTRLEPNMKYK